MVKGAVAFEDFEVQCKKCGVTGPNFGSIDDDPDAECRAAHSWNTRNAITPAMAAEVLLEAWNRREFTGGPDKLVQELLDFGVSDQHELLDPWLRAIAAQEEQE